MKRMIAGIVMLAAPVAAAANDFQAVRDKGAFLSLVQDRELRIGLYNLSLNVLPDGQIKGSALGWSITGSWNWQDGYFCRQMDWSGMEIDYNCQLVEAQGAEKLRFTVDQGAGDSATFRLR
ncbi:dihydrodipicolinate reductase [Tabrizicola sp.]|uniref:dihydrodipicolinate reductase n=1 Tax=Tabrizicola sp. TaxID=2005166 RepID=UPI002601C23E|nr:dihydrodipicolinate reductase [Tabrizicola sp.]MDM7932587.1 dihydrodipicolinate reductase [Tabrizicola sp.]